MKPNFPPFRSTRYPRISTAFTLVEIMIAVTLMSIIVLGLMAMFTQTQRAFRLGMNQTDVLEGGRIVTDMIVREIEQMTPSGKPIAVGATAPFYPLTTPGFYVELPSFSNVGQQLLPGGDYRTNYMEDLFFVTRENQTWKGIGYFVRTNAQYVGSFGRVGTLYRFESEYSAVSHSLNTNRFLIDYNNARSGSTNVSKVLDGVVHFSIKAYDKEGNLIAPPRTALGAWGGLYWWTNTVRADFPWPDIPLGSTRWVFFSNAVPAAVELEIGILEQQTYERYKGMASPILQGNYYTNHAGNVHLFRQRIPVHRFDVTAFR